MRRFITGLSLLAGAAARRSLAHGFDHNSPCPAINCFRRAGDPHLQTAMRRNGTVYSFLSAPLLQVNVLTEARTFKRARTATKRQLVHGSFITRAFIRLNATLPGGKIALVRIAILAEQYDTFRDYRTDDLPSFFLHTPQARYYNKTRIEVGDVAVMQLSGGRTFVRGAGWQFTIHRRRLMKPVVEGAAVAPSAGWTRLHWFLDTKFDVLDNNPTLVATHGRSTIGTIAPHGIIGQSFDGSMIAVSGKLDDYGDGPEFTTSAQAEGAIEGSADDYIVPSPFSTDFRFSRFSAISPVAPRNVSLLAGAKAAAVTSLSAGSIQLYGVETEETTPAPASFFDGGSRWRARARRRRQPPPPIPPWSVTLPSTNLWAAFDADDLSLADGASVQSWTNLQGDTSRNLGRYGTVTYDADGILGQPAVCFNGAGQLLSASNIATPSNGKVTAIITFKNTGSNNWEQLIGQGHDQFWAVRQYDTSLAMTMHVQNSNSPYASFNDNTDYIFVGRVDGGARDATVYTTGLSVQATASATSGATIASATSSHTKLCVGWSRARVSNEGFKGCIRRIAVYDTRLTDAQVSSILTQRERERCEREASHGTLLERERLECEREASYIRCAYQLTCIEP